MSEQGSRIILAERPTGVPTEAHLKHEAMDVPRPADGQMLLRTLYLSLDPYMRGRMSAARSYASSVEIGEVMVGATVSEVVESHLSDFAPGDVVLSGNGWQTHALSDGKGVRRLDPRELPVTTSLGVMGMPGFTAYAGLLEIGRPQPGETVVVSAASGAVGQVVGQIAKLHGCRAVGVAGANDKCEYVVNELGFDAAVNYKQDDFAEQLATACPDGIDVYFENVGGKVFEVVRGLLNDFARIPVCGRIAHYNDSEAPPGPNRLPGFMGTVLIRRLTVRGFIVSDFHDRMGDFLRDMGEWLREDKITYREDIVAGLDNAVSAFQGLLEGRNRGKLIVKVGEEPVSGG